MPDVSQPVAVTGSAGGLTLVLYIVYELIKKHNARKEAKLYAGVEKSPTNEGPPPPVFARVAPAIQQHADHAAAQHSLASETESQAQRARALSIESELLLVQQAMRRLRASLDEAAFENGRMKAALIEERGDSERISIERDRAVAELAQATVENTNLRAALLEERRHNKQLLVELAHLRREGGDSGTDARERRNPARGPSGGVQPGSYISHDVRPQADDLSRRTGRRKGD